MGGGGGGCKKKRKKEEKKNPTYLLPLYAFFLSLQHIFSLYFLPFSSLPSFLPHPFISSSALFLHLNHLSAPPFPKCQPRLGSAPAWLAFREARLSTFPPPSRARLLPLGRERRHRSRAELTPSSNSPLAVTVADLPTINTLHGKIQGDGRKFLERLKVILGHK